MHFVSVNIEIAWPKPKIFHLEISRIDLGIFIFVGCFWNIFSFRFHCNTDTEIEKFKNIFLRFNNLCVRLSFWHDSCIFYSGSQNLSKFYLISCYHVLWITNSNALKHRHFIFTSFLWKIFYILLYGFLFVNEYNKNSRKQTIFL